ncbi:hypothetical protein [Luteimonas pelagia]
MEVSPDQAALIEDVAEQFVYWCFPTGRNPAFCACPGASLTEALIRAVTLRAAEKGVCTEVVRLAPDPGEALDSVTDRLEESRCRQDDSPPPAPLLILDGFDLLEGYENEGPTYPFRSEFDIDYGRHLWLFLGQDHERLRRLFFSRELPLYRSASSLTPQAWRGEAGRAGSHRSPWKMPKR